MVAFAYLVILSAVLWPLLGLLHSVSEGRFGEFAPGVEWLFAAVLGFSAGMFVRRMFVHHDFSPIISRVGTAGAIAIGLSILVLALVASGNAARIDTLLVQGSTGIALPVGLAIGLVPRTRPMNTGMSRRARRRFPSKRIAARR